MQIFKFKNKQVEIFIKSFLIILLLFVFTPEKVKAVTPPPSCPAGQHWCANVQQCLDLGIDCNLLTPTTDTSNPNPNNNPVIVNPDPAISGNSDTNYTALAPLSEDLTTFDTKKPCAFGEYLNIVIKFLIALGAVMAMVMIVIGGMEYITSGGISSKESGKEKIKHAILGLLLALASYLILNSINPALLNICLDNIPKANIEVIEGDELATSFSPVAKSSLESLGISCPGSGGVNALTSIASSFNGKVTYSQSKRGTISNNTVYLDCSSFVKQVYQCAGLSFSGYSTATMFTGINSEAVSSVQGTQANGVDIEVGNLLGWKKGQSSRFPNAGHVVMYIGNSKFIEVHGGGGTNSAVSIRPLSYYAGQFKQIMRTP